MSKSFLPTTTTPSFASLLVQALQPILETMIPIVLKEKEEESSGLFGKANVAAPLIEPKHEYILYVQRFGPPPTGRFDEQALDILRAELGMVLKSKGAYPVDDGTRNTRIDG